MGFSFALNFSLIVWVFGVYILLITAAAGLWLSSFFHVNVTAF